MDVRDTAGSASGAAEVAPCPRDPAQRTALVIEDSPEFARLAESALSGAGYTVATASTGESGLARARALDPDVVLVDVELPGTDGYGVVQALRSFTDAYVVMVTGRSGVDAITAGLDLGADDHVTKPYSPRELLARLEALQRRPRASTRRQGDDASPLRVDADTRTVQVLGRPVALTPVELDLLLMLTARPGAVVRRDDLMLALWGSTTHVSAHSLDVHVANLRRKLSAALSAALSTAPSSGSAGEGGDDAARWPITTVRGVGFRYDPAPPPGEQR